MGGNLINRSFQSLHDRIRSYQFSRQIRKYGRFFWSGLITIMLFTTWSYTVEGHSLKETKQAPSAPQTSGISHTAVNIILENQSENYATRWFNNHSREGTKGVALVIHGLNLRPDKMQAIISVLTESGIDVLRMSLRGHGDNYSHHAGIEEDQARLETFKTVSYPLWLNETYLAYSEVQKRATREKVPLFFVGFSLGGLIGLNLFSSQEEIHYDRMVLFAPAVKVHTIHYLARLLSPFPRMVIPSLAPDSYLSNIKGTPIAAYNALFKGLRQFEKHVNRRVNVPTLIFIDKDDEFIPVGALKELKVEKKLDQWELYIIKKEAAANQDTFHHHIIDESSTGKAVWKEMMETTIAHLLTIKANK